MEKKARPTIRVIQGFRIIVGTNSGFCGLAILKKKMTRNTQNHGIDFNLHGEDYSLPLFLFVLLPEAARQHKATQEILSKWLKYNGMVLILLSFEEKHT